mmetsp:Transcript_21999/g.30338  ORF Transcript_21999/g.30338 Transcript_21999/m.30338 type:complete len:248 (+) Transcript_21999:20-763(+)
MTFAFKSLSQLEEHLLTRSYVSGFSFSEGDSACLKQVIAAEGGIPDKNANPNTYRWALHISALTGLGVNVKPASAAAKTAAPASSSAAKPAAAKAAAADDFDDLFGDEPEDGVNEDGENAAEAAATKARHDRMELARKLKEEKDEKEGKAKKEKAKPAEKSLVVLDVKPWEADTDLEMVWNKIKEYSQEGLTWGENFKLEPIAYGIKKLVMTATIVDSLVLLDDVTENIEALEEYVQSVTIASMNKI